MVGTFIDKYEVLQKIGEGGMATVYRGRHCALNRDVAIKVLHHHLSASIRNRQRFAREARAIERLDHENILKIFDYSGTDADDIYIVTEYVQGPTLRDLLDRRGLVPTEVAAMIGMELAAALSYAHTAGIIHRDLKPENVMIREDGAVKLMDFGIARFLDESTVTMTGSLVGSPAYMSPEQALERVLDPRSDLFSMGTLLFQLVTGQLPFAGSNPSVVLRNIIDGVRPGVLELQPAVSSRMAELVDRLLQTDIDGRPESARAVRGSLEAMLDEVQVDRHAPAWKLSAWLDDPEAYEARLAQHLEAVLLDRGKRCLARGDHLAAQTLFNRLLAYDPERKDVLVLLTELHRHGADRGARRLTWVGLGAVVLVAASGWWWLRPGEEAPAPEAVAREQPQPVLEAASPPPNERPAASAARPPAATEQPRHDAPPAPAAAPRPAVQPASPPSPAAHRRPASRSRPVAEEPPAPQEPGVLVVRLATASWADVYLDDERIGRTPPTSVYRLPPGEHTLVLRNPYARDHIEHFTIGSGEQLRFEGISLRRLPATIVFDDSLADDCAVAADGEDLGTVGLLGGRWSMADPEGEHHLVLACPGLPPIERDLLDVQPGGTVTLP